MIFSAAFTYIAVSAAFAVMAFSRTLAEWAGFLDEVVFFAYKPFPAAFAEGAYARCFTMKAFTSTFFSVVGAGEARIFVVSRYCIFNLFAEGEQQ
jgi:hypothetical protein